MAKIDKPHIVHSTHTDDRNPFRVPATDAVQAESFVSSERVKLEDVLIKARMVLNLAASTTHAPDKDIFGLMDIIKSLVHDIERLNERA